MRKLCCLLIIFFTWQITNAQNSGQQKIDSLLKRIVLADEDSNKVIMLLELSQESYATDSAKSFEYASKALELTRQLPWHKGERLALFNQAELFSNSGDFSRAINALLEAAKLAESDKDTSLLIRAYSETGDIYRLIENYTLAKSYQHQALALARKSNKPEEILKVLVYLDKISADLEEWDNVEKYSNEAMPLALSMKNDKVRAIILLTMANRSYKLGDYRQAITLYEQSLQIFRENEMAVFAIYTQTAISKAYADLKERDSAYFYANAAMQFTERYNLPKVKIDAYQALFYVSKSFGEYDKALLYYIKADSLDKAYYNLENAQNAERIRVKHEQEKKDIIALQEMKRQKNIRNFSFAGIAALIIFSLIVIAQRNRVRREKKRSDELLLNILPEETAEELKVTGSAKAKRFDAVTVLFTDFKNFTSLSEKLSAEDLVKEINFYYSAFDNIIARYGIEKIKTIGDSYMCASGLPVEKTTHATDAIKAALELSQFVEQEKQQRMANARPCFEIRIGLHSGPVVAGVVGIKKFAYDIWGDTVNIASRMESSGEVGKVNISSSTYELIKNLEEITSGKFTCTYRGKIAAKNKGEIDMYALEINKMV